MGRGSLGKIQAGPSIFGGPACIIMSGHPLLPEPIFEDRNPEARSLYGAVSGHPLLPEPVFEDRDPEARSLCGAVSGRPHSTEPIFQKTPAGVGEEKENPHNVDRKGQPEGCRVAAEVLGDTAAADDADADPEVP